MGAIIRLEEQPSVEGNVVIVIIIKGIRVVGRIDVNHGNRWRCDRACDASVDTDRGDKAECSPRRQEAMQ